MQVKKKTGQAEDTTVAHRIPVSLWKRVKIFAAQRCVSQQDIWIEALTQYLDRNAA